MITDEGFDEVVASSFIVNSESGVTLAQDAEGLVAALRGGASAAYVIDMSVVVRDLEEAIAALAPEENVIDALAIALSYTPIDPADLYEGCLGPIQCRDAALRAVAQFAAEGWAIVPAAVAGCRVASRRPRKPSKPRCGPTCSNVTRQWEVMNVREEDRFPCLRCGHSPFFHRIDDSKNVPVTVAPTRCIWPALATDAERRADARPGCSCPDFEEPAGYLDWIESLCEPVVSGDQAADNDGSFVAERGVG